MQTPTTAGALPIAMDYHAGAITDFDQAISLNPNDADAYYGRGLAKGNLGYHADAITDFDRAIARPDFDVRLLLPR